MDARAEAPAPPKTSVYLPVEDLPPKPEKPAMTADELSKLKKELTVARDHQAPNGQSGVSVAPVQEGRRRLDRQPLRSTRPEARAAGTTPQARE